MPERGRTASSRMPSKVKSMVQPAAARPTPTSPKVSTQQPGKLPPTPAGHGLPGKGSLAADDGGDAKAHIITERERRKRMKDLFTNLHALMPHVPTKVRLSHMTPIWLLTIHRARLVCCVGSLGLGGLELANSGIVT